jgi:hypothetical protein
MISLIGYLLNPTKSRSKSTPNPCNAPTENVEDADDGEVLGLAFVLVLLLVPGVVLRFALGLVPGPVLGLVLGLILGLVLGLVLGAGSRVQGPGSNVQGPGPGSRVQVQLGSRSIGTGLVTAIRARIDTGIGYWDVCCDWYLDSYSDLYLDSLRRLRQPEDSPCQPDGSRIPYDIRTKSLLNPRQIDMSSLLTPF